MLNEQEMQFADPDWKPTGPLSTLPTGPLSTQPIQPVTTSSWPASVTTPAPGQGYNTSQGGQGSTYDQGYQGTWPYAAPASQAFLTPASSAQAATTQGVSQRGHRRTRGWFWVIVVIICFVMGSGLLYSANSSSVGLKHPGMVQPMPAKSDSVIFGLKGATQLDINDLSGDITVQTNQGDGQNVFVRSSDNSQPQVNYQGQSASLTATGNGSIIVTVPQNIAVNISAGENNIDVERFSGQLIAQTGSGQITLNGVDLGSGSALNTNSGNITLEQASSVSDTSITSTSGEISLDGTNLSGNVTVSTGGNGSITYNGAVDPHGKYQFSTVSGNISLEFPMNTAMQLKISQKSGHYSSNFPPSTGSAPQASVGVTTSTGDITITGQ